MRGFAPSVLALSAGIVWAVVMSALLPASQRPSRAPAAVGSGAQAACTAPVMVAALPELREASGLAVSRRSPSLLWTHNDSGRPLLFGLGLDGAVQARVQVTGLQVEDWEDVSTGACPQGTCVFIADIGDNAAHRPQIVVYRTAEPAAADAATQSLETFAATYPDGPQDAEAVFVTSEGGVFVVTKGETGPVSVYRFPSPLRAGITAPLQRVVTLGDQTGKQGRITDADVSWDGQWVALRTSSSIAFYRTADLTSGKAGTPLLFNLAALHEAQGEGIALGPDGAVYLSGESGGGQRGGTLARMSCQLPQ